MAVYVHRPSIMGSNFRHYPYLCSELVSIATRDQPQAPAVHGNLEAIGERYALLLTEIPLAVGAKVAIRPGTQVLHGTVASCEFEDPLGYFIELQFGVASRWSRAMFEPEHLTVAGKSDPEPEAPRVFPLVSTEKFVPSRCNLRGNICTTANSRGSGARGSASARLIGYHRRRILRRAG